MSVANLIGVAKTRADLHVAKHKVRYTEVQSIVPAQVVRIRMPKYDDRMLDLRNLYMCFFLQGSTTDANACLDGQTVQTVIQRIRVLSGSTVIMDLSEADLLFQSLYDLNTEVNTSVAQQYIVGDALLADKVTNFHLSAPGQQYICKLGPRGSILNCDALLPIGRLNEFTIELTFNTAALSIYSPAPDNNATWTITSLELHADYIESKTISQHFNANPFNLTVTDYSWRYANLAAVTIGQVRWASAYTSLDQIYCILRDPTASQLIATQNKNRVALNGSNLVKYQVLVNQQNLYEDPILGDGSGSWEAFEEFRSAFPQVYTSKFFNSTFLAGNQWRLAVDFDGAPEDFRTGLLSGVNTGVLTNDFLWQPTFGSAVTARVDSFMCASVNVSLPGNRGDLQLTF